MIKPDISIQDSEVRIFFQDENFKKVIFDDERCRKLIIENLSFDISNDSYLIKDINKIKKNKLLRLERIVREFYDKDVIAKSSVAYVDDSVNRLLKPNATSDIPLTKETLVLFSGEGAGHLFVKNIYDETRAYRAYVDGNCLIMTNYIYNDEMDLYKLTFEKILGKLNFDNMEEFIEVFNIV